MLGLFRKPTVSSLPQSLRSSLSKERDLSEEKSLDLRMVQESGLYSGRKVTYFRVYNPVPLATPPRGFADLDAAGILYSGHIEQEGRVVLSR